MATYETITAADAKALLDSGVVVLVDVREPSEFEAVRIKGAVNVPLAAFDVDALAVASQGRPAVIMCKSGVRSGKACAQVAHVGGVRMLEGGILAWMEAGLPVQHGPSGWGGTLLAWLQRGR